MKKMSKTDIQKLQLLELATNYLQQVKDKKVKLALSTLIKKGTKDINKLTVKEIETVLEMVNSDAVFEEKTEDKKPDKKKVQKADKKTSKKLEKAKKEVEKSEVEIDYTKIFAEKVNCSELEKNHFFKKVNLSFEKIRELHHSGGDDVFLLAHWSKSDLETFNYAGTREVPEELCESFENDLDILKVIYVERYKDVLFAESVLTGATFAFLACDFQKTEKGCRFSEGLPFEIYVIEETKPRKRASKK